MSMRVVIGLALVGSSFGAAVPLSAQERFGSFFLYREADPIDDTNLSRLVVEGRADYDIAVPLLVWECEGERAAVYVDAGRFLDASDVVVEFRFDDDPPSEPAAWPPSSDGNAAFVPEDEVGDFTSAALRSASVVVLVRDYRQAEHTIEFPLGGLAEGLEALGCAPGP